MTIRPGAQFMTLRDLYSKESITKIVSKCFEAPLGQRGDLVFADFQRKHLNELAVPFTYDYASIAMLSSNPSADTEIPKFCGLGLHGDLPDEYLKVEAHDMMTPIAMLNPGRAVHTSQIMSQDAWKDSRFYYEHCRVFDIHNAIMVYFQMPMLNTKYLGIEYLSGSFNAGYEAVDSEFLEFASLLFALCWLYRFGSMDEVYVRRCLELLKDLGPINLRYLRYYVHSFGRKQKDLGADIGVAMITVIKHIQVIKESATLYLAETLGFEGRVSSREFDMLFDFIRLLKPYATEKIVTKIPSTYRIL